MEDMCNVRTSKKPLQRELWLDRLGILMISAFFFVLFLSNSKDIPDCYETTKVENHYYCKLRFNI